MTRLKKHLAAISFTVHFLLLTTCCFSQIPDSSRFGIFGAYAQEYDYFKNQMGFNDTQYWNWVDGHFSNLGAHWTRSNTQLIWNLIEPNLDEVYTWNIPTNPDSVITNVYNSPANVEWLGCISFNPSTHNPVANQSQWRNYLRAIVDRYNGDGVNDLNSYVKVKHWQIGNETFEYLNEGFTSSQYATAVAIADTAIRNLDSAAKICLVAPISGNVVDTFLINTIVKLNAMNVSFDIIDLHNWTPAANYKMTALPIYKNELHNNGYPNVEIWSCENGTWVYQPLNQPYQTQQEQAASLIKRYVWSFNNGLDKLMWNNLMEWYNFWGSPVSVFNSLGLIGDGQLNGEPPNELNFKRKSYYSYKLLASIIDSYYVNHIANGNFHNEPNGNYEYIYQDNSTADNLNIFWTDNTSETYTFAITSNYQLTEMVPYDSEGSFNTQSFSPGTHSTTIYNNQVYLLKKVTSAGLQDASNNNFSFHIYPNPFSSQTTLWANKYLSNATLSVKNIFGQSIVEIKNINGKKVTLQRNDLPIGLYFVRLTEDNKQTEIRKIIITD